VTSIRAASAAVDAPEDRGAAVTQRGTVAGGEHGREIAGIAVRHRVADGVDAEVNAVQAPRPNPSRDRRVVEPDRSKLRAAHDSVMGRGPLGEASFEVWGCSWSHSDH
jgi:hypothetical protein